RTEATDVDTLQGVVEPGQRGEGGLQVLFGVIDRAAVLARQQEIANHFGRIPLQHFAYGEEIAERLRHLFVVDTHRTVVHPQVDELRAGGAFGLRDLVVVMRKHQVAAAAVNVEGVAEAGGRHGRTFDVPARTTEAPG